MSDLATTVLLQLALFGGAFVSGVAGFAFSGVAGIILLRLLDPLEAVPLMMASSMVVQAMTYWSLRKSVKWCGTSVSSCEHLILRLRSSFPPYQCTRFGR